jgi:pimeloyl-ACP methyl ester carboxylesterase
MERGYIKTQYGQMHYLTEGSGEALILLHQTLRSSQVFTGAMPTLAKKYRVIAIDLPGFGNSDRFDGEISMTDHARNIQQCIDGLGIDRFSIGGIHTGGAIGAEIAIDWPHRVAALILIGFPYIRDETERADMRRQLGLRLHEGGLLVPEAVADGSYLSSLWHWSMNKLWWGLDGKIHEDLAKEELHFIESYVHDAIRGRDGMMQTHTALIKYDPDARLPLVKVPTLVIAETSVHQREILQRAEMVAKLVEGSKVVSIPGTDINLLYFKCREVTDAIMQFLANPKG